VNHDETPEREDLGYLLARASQRWDALLAERCRAHGFPEVRPAFGSILLPLFQQDGLRIGELADRARLSKQAMTTLVRDAADSGLVVRERDPGDGRAYRIQLTERADEFRPVADVILAEMDEALGKQLSGRSAATLRRSLRAVKDLPLQEGQPG
jgi:DNA-binding MarR family transcriptional regulator